jgi:membrane-bound lytic murein transglycosylase MltF
MTVPAAVLRYRLLLEKHVAMHTVHVPPIQVLTWQEPAAILWSESTGNPLAFNPGDPSWGLMGITSLIAHAYGGFAHDDISWHEDPEKNIKCGVAYLADLKKKHAEKFPNYGYVGMYNAGEPKVLAGFHDAPYVEAFLAHLKELTSQETAT